MIIIGEKINGTIPSVKAAIEKKDADYIAALAVKQTEAGATYIDVCASTAPEFEIETLKWLMDIVQNATDTPLCLDSPNPRVIEAVFKYANKPGLINSISEEGDKCEVLLPLLEGNSWQVVGLTCDNKGIPSDVETKLAITRIMVEKAAKYGITPDRIHIDPCVMALSTENNSMLNFAEEIRQIKALYPTIHVTGAISNMSFGLPVRSLLNKTCMAFAMEAGMDSAVIDPLNRDMMGTIFATYALLGQDKHCRKYSKAYRQGQIGPVK
ncbi:methyltetrahydrofolate cobalamin methyltransferase [Acetobacterium wieringae]|uniref:methyltetrahydrofolate cobalamin methyltransferase n=1 Tax=Acetobacterium wieringae TaxID=52694 RepID=UPI001D38CB78|nr:methyltetrahydrofolate cobalamin methyltransferase [Acetobacterium wieringae]MEA4805565.1 methyltetrahydrofolate cobalamin methyltransferase [Acetobacterium wieringae]VUZ28236.1 5-methyltetrahydrofolate:corrinoid/iron-sulfur protein co-methyltransferase [Acetobacterium wieringae]